MVSRSFSYVGALLLLQALPGCSRENSSTNETTAAPASPATPSPEIAEEKLVVAFGDSLYAGYGVAPDESFPSELQKALRGQGLAVSVHNAGVSGDTSAAGLRRLAFTLDGLPRKPDLFMLNLGGNDMLRGVDPAETRRNLVAICEAVKRRGIPILITGMVAAPNLGRDYAASFNPIYPDLAKRFDAALYPFFLDGVVTDRGLMQEDRIHPNPAGVDRIVGKVAPLVAASLAASKPRP